MFVEAAAPLQAAPFQPAVRPVTLQPNIIPMDAPDVVNPGRGYYRWRGVEIVPSPEPAHDEYERYFWFDPDHPEASLETAPGEYNFEPIERDIAAAAARGHKFAFRIRAMANKRSNERFVPDYLAQCGWDYRGTFIPDWNAPCFLDNAARLMKALGERYDGDPRIAWMDIGLYGEWGEWALSEEIYLSAPKGIDPPDDASLERIIDLQIAAFPRVRKVMFAKTRASAVIYALSRSEQIGWRVDCFGRQGYFNFSTNHRHVSAWKYMQDRWKTAPVIVEFCADNVSLESDLPLQQVQDFHIALIGNGNFRNWDRLSEQQQQNLILIGKSAGYRFQIRQVTAPNLWRPGARFRIITDWENAGVSPHYEPATVLFRLYEPKSGRVVWEAASGVDLQALLPTGDKPETVEDNFSLPNGLAPGIYQLRVIVIDPSGYRKPLKLAISGQREDGSYILGNVVVVLTESPTD